MSQISRTVALLGILAVAIAVTAACSKSEDSGDQATSPSATQDPSEVFGGGGRGVELGDDSLSLPDEMSFTEKGLAVAVAQSPDIPRHDIGASITVSTEILNWTHSFSDNRVENASTGDPEPQTLDVAIEIVISDADLIELMSTNGLSSNGESLWGVSGSEFLPLGPGRLIGGTAVLRCKAEGNGFVDFKGTSNVSGAGSGDFQLHYADSTERVFIGCNPPD